MSVFAKASASRSRSLKAVLGGVAILSASALVLSGCAAAEQDTTPAKPTETLELKIGTALPVSGSLAFLGPPEIAGVGLAVEDINAADLGVNISVVYGDSGDTDNKAYETEVPRLLSENVSAIIGAASSGTSKQFIDSVVGAGVVQFSPANTSVDFTTWDDNGLYWRTAPSDLLQGEVLGTTIAADGISDLAIINREDSYGTGLSAKAAAIFEETGGTVVSTQTYKEEDTIYTSQVSATLAANPEAILLVAFEEAKAIIPLLAQGGFDLSKLYLTDGDLADYSADFTPLGISLEGAKGTLPGLDLDTLGSFKDNLSAYWLTSDQNETGEALKDFAYGPESYDAVVLIALASLAAGSTDGVDIAAKLQEVSGGSGDGTKCTTFAECAQLILDGETVDYDGNSGPVTFDEVGDPTEATMGVYQYLADNTYERIN
jgi:branched-chain amino acid transport system substrate-binding protein